MYFIAKRVFPWHGKFMSSGARLILTNLSLSSLTLFTMGLFLLADGIHAKLDTPCSKFFWEGAGSKRKYHMVNWATVYRSKSLGGLGIINLKLMNISLLSKWIWRLSQNASGLWAALSKAKYFPDIYFFESKVCGSPFWNGIQAVKPIFALGAKFSTGNGQSMLFYLTIGWIYNRF